MCTMFHFYGGMEGGREREREERERERERERDITKFADGESFTGHPSVNKLRI
jgi:hypothetical protein